MRYERTRRGPRTAWLRRALLAGVLATCAPPLTGDLAAAARDPAVLVVPSGSTRDELVDLAWMAELAKAGFEPDYLNDLGEFEWDRIRRYDVLILFSAPSPRAERSTVFDDRKRSREEYVALVERFLAAGGGVFFMAYIHNADSGLLPLLEPWGARLPYEYYRETDPSRLAPLPRMQGRYSLVRIDDIAPSPISEGVRQLWWPYADQYSASYTAPIAVDESWTVVVRGSPTSRTEPVTRENTRRFRKPPERAVVRKGGVKAPALLALRKYRAGRIVLLSQQPQFSIGQGTRWLFERRTLDRGIASIPSDWGRMVQNALRWLAAPSLAGSELGGYRMKAGRLEAPNLRPGARKITDQRWGIRDDSRKGRVFRGLLGAQSELSGGAGSVEAYAAAAREAGLDFLIFMEDFRQLSEKRLRKLERQCRKLSDASLLLLPGYTIDDNIGGHLFFYGRGLPWPPDYVLTPNQRLNLQMRDERGRYIKKKTTHNWLLQAHATRGASEQQIGFYDFRDAGSPRIYDLRDFSATGVETWQGTKQLDERWDDYLVAVESTMPPLPLVVTRVRAPTELSEVTRSGQPLVHVVARRLSQIPQELGWTNAYDSARVFLSDGPHIQSWPGIHRVMVYGAEPFVADREPMRSRLRVSSKLGLREIRVMAGRRLLRRFLPGGARSFDQVLHLPGVIQETTVVIAEDAKGGRALSFARRSRKDGSLAVVFCGDRVNDCDSRQPLLARGPGVFALHHFPVMPAAQAGFTWDGGPQGLAPSVLFDNTHPEVETRKGMREGERDFANLPILELSDDQVVVTRSELERVFAADVPVVNAWHTWGPIEPSKLVLSNRRLVRFNTAAEGPPATGLAFTARRSGAVPTLFRNELALREPGTVASARIARASWKDQPELRLVTRGATGTRIRPIAPDQPAVTARIDPGAWFGFFAGEATNAAWFANRGEALEVVWKPGRRPHLQLRLAEAQRATPDDPVVIEVFGLGDPLETALEGPQRLEQIVSYLAQPGGLRITRGQRRQSTGLLEIDADDGWAGLSLPRPETPVELTLPVRVHGLNRRWSAGLYQLEGYTAGSYTDGRKVYAPVGIDEHGAAHLAVFPDHGERTVSHLGHPLVADAPELFLEVAARPSQRKGQRYDWRVTVNNPEDREIRSWIRPGMPVPGLSFQPQEVVLAPGELRVLYDSAAPDERS